jgi:hypothetical protein
VIGVPLLGCAFWQREPGRMTSERLGEPMSYVSRIGAVLSGIALCIVSVHLLNTEGSFEFVAIDGLVRALPCFILSLAWFWVTLRWLARPARVAIWWLVVPRGLNCWFYLLATELRLLGL